MEVGIALAVGMRQHVDGHAVDSYVYVCAMVEVEAAKEYLFGFAATCVLCNEQTRHYAEHLLRRLHGVGLQIESHGFVEVSQAGTYSHFMQLYAPQRIFCLLRFVGHCA